MLRPASWSAVKVLNCSCHLPEKTPSAVAFGSVCSTRFSRGEKVCCGRANSKTPSSRVPNKNTPLIKRQSSRRPAPVFLFCFCTGKPPFGKKIGKQFKQLQFLKINVKFNLAPLLSACLQPLFVHLPFFRFPAATFVRSRLFLARCCFRYTDNCFSCACHCSRFPAVTLHSLTAFSACFQPLFVGAVTLGCSQPP